MEADAQVNATGHAGERALDIALAREGTRRPRSSAAAEQGAGNEQCVSIDRRGLDVSRPRRFTRTGRDSHGQVGKEFLDGMISTPSIRSRRAPRNTTIRRATFCARSAKA